MNEEPSLKDIFHVAGDQPDPMGSNLRGVSAGYQFTQAANGHPMLVYRLATGRELVLEADVYKLPGQPMYVHLLCPMCLMHGRQNALRIVEGNKAISYEPRDERGPFPGWTADQMAHAFPRGVGGILSVEAFACTWEQADDAKRDFGLSRCNWRVAIDRNVVRNV